MNKKSLTVNYETAREFSFQYADIHVNKNIMLKVLKHVIFTYYFERFIVT